jgi:hypothetical protein
MNLDFEELLLSEHIGTGVLVSLELLPQLLYLYGEIIDDTSVIVCTAAVCRSELRGGELVVVVYLLFIRRIGLFLKERGVNCQSSQSSTQFNFQHWLLPSITLLSKVAVGF